MASHNFFLSAGTIGYYLYRFCRIVMVSKFFFMLVPVLLFSGLMTACDSTNQTPTNSSSDGQALSFSNFHTAQGTAPLSISALLSNSCGDPTSCHGAGGNQGGAFRIFPADVLNPGQANDTSNYISALAQVIVATPDLSPLLRKPLAETGGGIKHKGGIIFSDTDDPDYVTIRNWITSGS